MGRGEPLRDNSEERARCQTLPAGAIPKESGLRANWGHFSEREKLHAKGRRRDMAKNPSASALQKPGVFAGFRLGPRHGGKL